MAWGVRPQAMIGHSIGEYVAACLAGVFSLEDALALVTARGHLMQQLPVGAMLAVALSEQEVQPLLGPALSLAASNGPSACVVAGPVPAVDALEQRLRQQDVPCRRLQTSHAFHSAMMEPIVEPFLARLNDIDKQPPAMPYVSNVTGTWITAAQATDARYWAGHLRQTVRFAAGLHTVLQEPESSPARSRSWADVECSGAAAPGPGCRAQCAGVAARPPGARVGGSRRYSTPWGSSGSPVSRSTGLASRPGSAGIVCPCRRTHLNASVTGWHRHSKARIASPGKQDQPKSRTWRTGFTSLPGNDLCCPASVPRQGMGSTSNPGWCSPTRVGWGRKW